MSFNLMQSLMDGTSFGTGFINEQDRQHQIGQQDQQFQMAMMMNRMKLQEQQKNLGYEQAESDYAKQLSTDPDTMDLPVDKKMDLMTNNALAQGDLVRANELATNATNFRQAQVNQDQKRQAVLQGQIKNQQALHQYMGSELAAAAEGGKDEFDHAKMIALSSGMGTPEDQQKLSDLQWDPDLARRLRLGAMTSRQQAQTLIDQQKANQTKANQERLDSARQQRLKIQQQRLADQEAAAAVKAKAGGGQKAPTDKELEQAAVYLKDSGLDPKSTDFAQAQQQIVGVAKQIQKANPNVTYPQAVQQAAQKIGKQDIHTITTPGIFKDTKTTTYKMEGATPQSPITYTGDPSTLIPGRYYSTGSHGVVQFTGTGFVQVKS